MDIQDFQKQSSMVLPNTNPLPDNGMNGRVNLSPSASASGSAAVPGFTYRTSVEDSFAADALRGNWEVTPLASAFFSRSNVIVIQNLIRKQVYEKSGPKKYIIDDQSVDELTIIMRTMYLQYAQNLPYGVADQIHSLNTLVANWSVPHIMSAVDHYNYYLNDISHMPVPLARSVSLSSAGTKSLPLNPFV
uniref:Minor capsid protein P8 central region domain-containing protein n=1 Tax=viral metagenome TaxID=1070528 RepID=A0A6C0LMN4_9ZZZZ